MKFVGVIPARYKSTRFPGKPLAQIRRKPMIWWVYQQVKQVKGLDDIIVATDDARIEKTCVEYGMKVIMTSDLHQTGTDRLGEVAERIYADFYVNIQGDEPLIEPAVIEKLIQYQSSTNAKIVNTYTEILEPTEIQKNTIVKAVVTDNGLGLYLSRSSIPYPKNQQLIKYYKHLGLYIIGREELLFFSRTPRGKIEMIEDIEMLRFIENGYQIRFIEVQSDSIAVDIPDDIMKVENYMKERIGRE